MSNDLTEARRIVQEGLKGYAVRIYLFGSQVTGNANSASDIDVAIEPLQRLPSGLLSLIRERLEESCVLQKVDIVDLSLADEVFKERIQQEGILWKEPGKEYE